MPQAWKMRCRLPIKRPSRAMPCCCPRPAPASTCSAIMPIAPRCLLRGARAGRTEQGGTAYDVHTEQPRPACLADLRPGAAVGDADIAGPGSGDGVFRFDCAGRSGQVHRPPVNLLPDAPCGLPGHQPDCRAGRISDSHPYLAENGALFCFCSAWHCWCWC